MMVPVNGAELLFAFFSQNQAKSYCFTVTFKPSFLYLTWTSKMDEPEMADGPGEDLL